MELSQQLRQMIAEQARQIQALEKLATAVEETDLLQENEELRHRISELSAQLEQEREGGKKLEEECALTKAKLLEQVRIRRELLLQNSRQYVDRYFAKSLAEDLNTLTRTEKQALERLKELRQSLSANKVPGDPQLQAQLARTEQMAKELLEQHTAAVKEQYHQAYAVVQAGYQEVERQAAPEQPDPILPGKPPPGLNGRTPKPRRERKPGSLEISLGSRIANIVGLAFMLLAVVFGLRYSFEVVQSDVIKGLIAYLIGGLFLAGGELMNIRKGRTPFSIGLCAGGVAILFASTAVSYFTLGILPVPGAVGICIVVTAAALLLSLRYDSQFIAIFALLGGYLPMTAVENAPLMVLSVMLYFLLLNLFVLLIAANKQWQPIKFFSLSCSGLGMTYLLGIQKYAWVGANTLYILAFFLLYVGVVLVYPFLRRTKMRASDTVLLGMNAFFCCANSYTLLNMGGYSHLNGLMALIFCAAFFALARLVTSLLTDDAGAKGLFYASAAVFLVLGIPLQLEPELISLGWLAEGVALCVYGILANRKWYRYAGMATYFLCLGWFLTVDTLQELLGWWFGWDHLYVWKISAVVLGAVVILLSIYYRHSGEPEYWGSRQALGARIVKYATVCGVWIYLLYMIQFVLGQLSRRGYLLGTAHWVSLLRAAATLGVAVSIKLIPILRDKGTVIIARILYGVGFLMALYFNTGRVWTIYQQPATQVLSWLALIVFNLLVVAALYDCMRDWGAWGPRLLPVALSGISLVLTLQVLLTQTHMGFANMIVSFVLLAWAMGMILVGFIRRIASVRRSGLGLSLFSITKLFLLDLAFLQSGQRVLSYFVFGLIFIGISYLYQFFAQRLAPARVGNEDAAADTGQLPQIPPAVSQDGAEQGQGGDHTQGE